MRTIPLTSILIPENRQRTEFPDEYIADLMESIFSATGAGLLQPIVLREGKILMAGECRTKAATMGYKLMKRMRHEGQDVPMGEIPYLDFGELTPLQQMEAEFAENAQRLDLNWKDRAKAIADLHALRQAQRQEQIKAAEATNGDLNSPLPNKNIPDRHSINDTAHEVFKQSGGKFSQVVSDSITLTANMHRPEIAKATNLAEARKILKRIESTELNKRLAEKVGKVSASEKMRLFHTECEPWMKEQPDGQYDVILTDPPYGMGADEFGDAAGRMAGIEHEYKDSEERFKSLMGICIPEFWRLAKPEAHLYLWCDIEWFTWLRDACRAVGWWTHRTPLVNIKPEGGRVPWPENGPRRCYELCLYAVKGKRPVNSIKPDVFESRLVEGNFGHGAQKPVEAYVELLSRSVRPGDKVFDAFAGTGTIFPAAHALGCYADGCEMNASGYGIGVKRIGELV